MDGLGGRGHVVVVRLALPRRGGLGGRRRGERRASSGQGNRASGRNERAFQEAAPFGVEIVEQPLVVELEFRAIVIIACTHWMALLCECPADSCSTCANRDRRSQNTENRAWPGGVAR